MVPNPAMATTSIWCRLSGVHQPMGVGVPVEAGPEALPLDELDGHSGGLRQPGRRQVRSMTTRSTVSPASSMAARLVPAPDARTPSRGRWGVTRRRYSPPPP